MTASEVNPGVITAYDQEEGKNGATTNITTNAEDEEVQEYISHEKDKKSLGKRILWLFWDSGGKDPETRAFVNRLDCCLLLYAVYSYIVKYLLQSSVSVSWK